MSRTIDAMLFPGNAGRMDYAYLDKKVADGARGYEPMSADVEHLAVETALGTRVGVHVYRASQPKPGQDPDVVIFNHGNVRPSRYMNDLLEQLAGNVRVEGRWLPENRKRTVIARDFVGYDMSTAVVNENGAMEVASQVNDRAVYQWAVDQFGHQPTTRFFVGGRSIGTNGWVNELGGERVAKAFGFVPYAFPAPLLRAGIVELARRVPVVGQVLAPLVGALVGCLPLELATARAFPAGVRPSAPHLHTLQTHGFTPATAIAACGESLAGKEVWLFPAERDELVPSDAVPELQARLMEAGA
ncbi:MAG TPA: hypothetical protein VFH51_02140, partial [Myxococcota bacterium]|nr:hypothetical protein [Myxococcota bacterium]